MSPIASSRGKILVIRGGAIGDFILTLPVFSALKENFPDTHLEVLGYPHITDLAVAGGLVTRARSIEARSLAAFFARGGTLSPELSEYFGSFAIIVSYLFDPDGIFQTNVAKTSKAQFIVGPHRPDENGGVHASEVFLKPLERLAIFEPDAVAKLSLPKQLEMSREGAAMLKPIDRVALHPGSGAERKNWPVSRWAELIEHLLTETDRAVLVIGGEADMARLSFLRAQFSNPRLEFLESRPLVEVAEALQRSSAFVGHDSGISHLASALGVPGLVLWGDTNEVVWKPRGIGMRIVREPGGLENVLVERVASELSLLLG